MDDQPPETGGGSDGPVAPMAEFDKTPPEEGSQGTLPLDDLPPPPHPHSAATAISITESSSAPASAQSETLSKKEKKKKKEKEAKEHYQQSDDADDDMSCGRWCEYVLVVVLASLLLLSALILVLFWTLYYRKGFAWQESPEHQFNLHPTLMVAGFISFSGFSMLLYRISRCCRQIYVKLFHMLFHALAIPCIVIGFIAVWDSKNLSVPPIKNFYSMHSWMGLITMGLFALQFVVGFFSFLILLCCEGATAAFRAALVPIHASFGVITFMLAVATCLTGLTQKAILQFGKPYTEGFTYESLLMNIIAMVLVACSIVVSYALNRVDYFKYQGRILVPADGDLKEYASWPEESIIMNALAMVLVALGILVSYAVRRNSLGQRPGSSQDGGKFISERL